MTRRRPPTPSGDDILRADPRAVDLLAASDTESWKCLLQHLDDACPSVLVRALLEIDDAEGWRTGHRGCVERFEIGQRLLAEREEERREREPDPWDR